MGCRDELSASSSFSNWSRLIPVVHWLGSAAGAEQTPWMVMIAAPAGSVAGAVAGGGCAVRSRSVGSCCEVPVLCACAMTAVAARANINRNRLILEYLL